jgi:FixJ family two-component response regulator
VFAADVPGNCNSEKLANSIETKGTGLPMVFYSEQPTAPQIVGAMLSGALDYLEWPFEAKLLNKTFDRLATEGEERTMKERRKAEAKMKVGALTPREREVLTLMVGGLANKENASVLDISRRTVEIHRGNMLRKLGATSTSDAVRIALYAGLETANPSPG